MKKERSNNPWVGWPRPPALCSLLAQCSSAGEAGAASAAAMLAPLPCARAPTDPAAPQPLPAARSYGTWSRSAPATAEWRGEARKSGPVPWGERRARLGKAPPRETKGGREGEGSRANEGSRRQRGGGRGCGRATALLVAASPAYTHWPCRTGQAGECPAESWGRRRGRTVEGAWGPPKGEGEKPGDEAFALLEPSSGRPLGATPGTTRAGHGLLHPWTGRARPRGPAAGTVRKTGREVQCPCREPRAGGKARQAAGGLPGRRARRAEAGVSRGAQGMRGRGSPFSSPGCAAFYRSLPGSASWPRFAPRWCCRPMPAGLPPLPGQPLRLGPLCRCCSPWCCW